jgi:hypothetical protein
LHKTDRKAVKEENGMYEGMTPMQRALAKVKAQSKDKVSVKKESVDEENLKELGLEILDKMSEAKNFIKVDIREGKKDEQEADKWAAGNRYSWETDDQHFPRAKNEKDDHRHLANAIVRSSSKWPKPENLKATHSGYVSYVHHADDRNVGTKQKPHYNRGFIKIYYKGGKIHLDRTHPHPSPFVKIIQLPLKSQKGHKYKVTKSSYSYDKDINAKEHAHALMFQKPEKEKE